MTLDNDESLTREWELLQQSFDAYERFTLLIKLLAVLLVSIGWLLSAGALVVILLVLVLWFQESIWKTFQGRIGGRLMKIEAALVADDDDVVDAYQLHTDWQRRRPDNKALIAEYLVAARKPTVAFPYAVLLLIIVLT